METERKPGTASISHSKGVQQGDGNVQINHFYANPDPAARPPLETALVNIDPELAIAYYDRVKIFPNLDAELSQNKVSTIFLLGGKQDWHKGLWKRLENHIRFRLNETARYACVTWSHQQNLQARAEFSCWDQVVKAFGESPRGNIQQIQQHITQNLSALSLQLSHMRVVIRYDISDSDWNDHNKQCLNSIVQDWQKLHQDIQKNSGNGISIGLVFCVVEQPQSMFTRMLNLLYSRDVSSQETDFDTYAQLLEEHPDAFFCALPRVTEDEIDEWVEALKAGLSDDVRDAAWWTGVKVQMRKQLARYRQPVEHKTLRDDLVSSEKFIRIWGGKID